MREHSLQLRFFIIVISAILTVTIFVGGFSIYEVDNYIQKETKNLVEVTCENEATKIILSDFSIPSGVWKNR